MRYWPKRMHELAVCQDIIGQVEDIAREHGADKVELIKLRIGKLSGVESDLLESAFTIARAGTLADSARLEIEAAPIKVSCQLCGAVSEAQANRLICKACGAWQTRLISGDEMILQSVELT